MRLPDLLRRHLGADGPHKRPRSQPSILRTLLQLYHRRRLPDRGIGLKRDSFPTGYRPVFDAGRLAGWWRPRTQDELRADLDRPRPRRPSWLDRRSR